MKFKLGNLEVETSEAFGTDAFTPYALNHQSSLGRTPRAVYFWDCRLGPRNPKKPKYLVIEPSMTTLVLTPAGREDSAKTSASGRRLLAASGAADADALNDELLKEFPPVTFRIPWDKLETLLSSTYSKRYYAWISFIDLFVTPTHGPTQDRYILSYPVAADFVATAVDVCPMETFFIPPPPDKTGSVSVKPSSGRPKDFGEEFGRNVARRLQEEREKMTRLSRRIKAKSDQARKKYKDRLTERLDDILDEMDDF